MKEDKNWIVMNGLSGGIRGLEGEILRFGALLLRELGSIVGETLGNTSFLLGSKTICKVWHLNATICIGLRLYKWSSGGKTRTYTLGRTK